MPNKEFEIVVLRKAQWAIRKHRKTIQWNQENNTQNEFKYIREIIKKKKKRQEFWSLGIQRMKWKNAIEVISNRLNQAAETTCDLHIGHLKLSVQRRIFKKGEWKRMNKTYGHYRISST